MTLGSSSWVLGLGSEVRVLGRRRCWVGAEPSFVSFSPARPWPHAFCLSALPRALLSPLHRDIDLRRSQEDDTATHWEPKFSRPFPRKSASGCGGGLGLLGFFARLRWSRPCHLYQYRALSRRPLFSSSPPPLLLALSLLSSSLFCVRYMLLHGSYMRGRLLSRPNSPLLALPPAA